MKARTKNYHCDFFLLFNAISSERNRQKAPFTFLYLFLTLARYSLGEHEKSRFNTHAGLLFAHSFPLSERDFGGDAQRVCQAERSLMSPLAGTKRAS